MQGCHTILRHPKLRVFWWRHFPSCEEVPWETFWGVFPKNIPSYAPPLAALHPLRGVLASSLLACQADQLISASSVAFSEMPLRALMSQDSGKQPADEAGSASMGASAGPICRPTIAVELGKLFVQKANRKVFQSLVSRRTQQVRSLGLLVPLPCALALCGPRSACPTTSMATSPQPACAADMGHAQPQLKPQLPRQSLSCHGHACLGFEQQQAVQSATAGSLAVLGAGPPTLTPACWPRQSRPLSWTSCSPRPPASWWQ